MKSYVLCVCFAILFCVGISILVPGKKYMGIMKIICGIFILYTILTPLKGVLFSGYTLSDVSDFLKDDDGFFDAVERSKRNFERALISGSHSYAESEIASAVSRLNGSEVTVTLEPGENTTTAYLIGADKEKQSQISDFLKKTYALEAVFAD